METTNGSPLTSRRSCPQWHAASRVVIAANLSNRVSRRPVGADEDARTTRGRRDQLEGPKRAVPREDRASCWPGSGRRPNALRPSAWYQRTSRAFSTYQPLPVETSPCPVCSRCASGTTDGTPAARWRALRGANPVRRRVRKDLSMAASRYSTVSSPRRIRPVGAAAALAVCVFGVLAARPAVAGAGDPDTAASAFAVRTVRQLVENRYAAAWRTLHPSHQRAVGGRARYVACELSAPITETVVSIEGIGVRDRTASFAGIGRARAKAVTVRVAFADAQVPEGVPVTLMVHVLRVKGAWRWVLPNSRYAGYLRGDCV